jgi:hypothetical protein
MLHLSAAPDSSPEPTSAAPALGPPSSAGFAVRLDGASLADLIQMECMRGTRRVIRVSSAQGTGYLFFDRGQLLHATTGTHTGDPAVLSILSWSNGTYEASEQAWPVRTTVESSWQNLLLLSAQHADESTRDEVPDSSEVVSSPKPREVAMTSPRPLAPGLRVSPSPTAPPEPPATESKPASSEPSSAAGRTGIIRAVRIDENGNVVSNLGTLGEFADLSSYAVHMCKLIGDSLGLEGFQGIECTARDRTFLAFVDQETVVAIETEPGANIDKYRRKAGL